MLKAIPSSNTVHIMIIVSCLIRLSKVKNNDFSSSETTIIIMLHSWTMVIQQVIQYSFITIKISKEKWQPFSCELGEFIFLRPIDQASQSRFRNPPHRPARPKRKNIFLVCIFIVPQTLSMLPSIVEEISAHQLKQKLYLDKRNVD